MNEIWKSTYDLNIDTLKKTLIIMHNTCIMHLFNGDSCKYFVRNTKEMNENGEFAV